RSGGLVPSDAQQVVGRRHYDAALVADEQRRQLARRGARAARWPVHVAHAGVNIFLYVELVPARVARLVEIHDPGGAVRVAHFDIDVPELRVNRDAAYSAHHTVAVAALPRQIDARVREVDVDLCHGTRV